MYYLVLFLGEKEYTKIFQEWKIVQKETKGIKNIIISNNSKKHIENVKDIINKNLEKCNERDVIEIYTDGSFKDGKSGYGVIFVYKDEVLKTFSAKVKGKQTNNTGELFGILKALQVIKKCDVNNLKFKIITDSMYSYGAIFREIEFKTKNKEIISQIQKIFFEYFNSNDIDICIEHTYSHIGNKYNEMVDQIAKESIL